MDRPMPEPSLAERVTALDPGDRAGLTVLATDLRRGPAAAVQTLHRLWLEGGPPGANARRLLGHVGELAFDELLRLPKPAEPLELAWRLRTLVAVERGLRKRLADDLEAALADLRPIPAPDVSVPMEEGFAPRRVADEAYLLLRRVVEFGGDDEGQVFDERAYLALTAEQRDAVLATFRSSAVFARLADLVE